MTESTRMFANRYELGELIGRGGMAEVHIGYDNRLGRTVAIKILRSEYLRDPSFQTRFRREAQAAAGLNHPSIVAVYDTGEEQVVGENGDRHTVPFIVMEYVEGHTVRDILKDGAAAPIEEAVEILAGVLSALEYSHAAQLVHRDIKPANVMLTPTGAVKVMDFGIARALADVGQTMTQSQAVVGTAQYLSPEQARGENVDARSDLYSAGCLLFELLCGRPPFVGDSPVSVAYQHVRETAPKPSDFAPDVPPALDQIVARSLAKDPNQRYQTAQEFLADLNAVMSGQVPLGATGTLPVGSAAAGSGAHAVAAAAAANPATKVMPAAVGGPGTPMGGIPSDDEYEVFDEAEDRKRRIRNIIILVGTAVVAAFAIYGLFKLATPATTETPPVTTVVNVPDVVRMTQDRATSALEAASLVPVIQSEPSEDVPEGNVIRTDPVAGTEVSPNSTIAVYISTGIEQIEIPTTRGLTEETARQLLEDLGLVVLESEKDNSDPTIEQGRVTKSDPPQGFLVGKNTEVTLYVSSGKVQLPDLVGMQQDVAQTTLYDLRLTPKIVEVPTNDSPEGEVLSQSPQPGLVKVGKTITLEVAVPAVEVVMPDVIDDAENIAISAFTSRGLLYTKTEEYSCFIDAGNVISTNPTAGTTIIKGSTVSYVLSLGEDPGSPCSP